MFISPLPKIMKCAVVSSSCTLCGVMIMGTSSTEWGSMIPCKTFQYKIAKWALPWNVSKTVACKKVLRLHCKSVTCV